MSDIFLSSKIPVSVKICGLMTEEMVDFAVGSGAHGIGFVLVNESPRCIDRQLADQLTLQLPNDVIGVAVLRNEPSLDSYEDWNGWLQLCGEEDENYVQKAPRPVIKALQWNKEEVLRWDGCPNLKAILVDGSAGGLGEQFDVDELAGIIPSMKTPIIIAGGLNSENVQEVIRKAGPAGVDVSSGVESTRGIKDPEKIFEFIQQTLELT